MPVAVAESLNDIASSRETGRFVGWDLIGHGGSADVFKVEDRELGVPLAVKILKQDHSSDRRYIESLRREVLISRRLRHPNICPIHDLYEGERGVGIVMDLIQGQDLKAWLKSNRGNLLNTMPARLSMLRKLCEALKVAHTLIVHRDLKPANIFLLNGDIANPVIMDFGMSTDAAEGGMDGGTPKYMAPEQFLRDSGIDHRADLFALGILAYEVLTDGQIPACSLKDVIRTGALPEFDRRTIPPPSAFCAAIPADLDQLVLQLIEYDPAHRPANAGEVAETLAVTKLVDAYRPSATTANKIQTASIEAGTYIVGDKASNRACDQPERKVRIGGFRMGLTPVTNQQYRTFLSATGHKAPPLLDHALFGHDQHPVVMVSFADAEAYARWAGGRLPTEAEWEIAARAGQPGNRFPWGNSEPQVTLANIDNHRTTTTPVTGFPRGANGLGMADCCGNVWEWCASDWDDSLWKTLPADARATALNPEADKAIRGGSFDSPSIAGRTSFRHNAEFNSLRADIGFRIAFDD